MTRVFLVTAETSTTNAVTTALSANGRLDPRDVCRDLAELLAHLERHTPSAVLVDLDPHPGQMLSSLEPIVRKFPETRFILLSTEMEPRLLVEAMQIGARHYMAKRDVATELLSALHRLCAPRGGAAQGAVLAVMSAAGGCGATTLAINLAHETQLQTHNHTLLVDLDGAYSSVGACLGLGGNFGVVDLLRRLDPVDSEMITTTMQKRSEHLHVLVNAANDAPLNPVLPNPERLEDLISASRRGYRHTVLDAPRLSLDVAADVARASDLTLVVLQLTVKDLRVARLLIAGLLERGINGESIVVVANRYRRRGSAIELEEARKVVGHERWEVISSDYLAACQAINMGKPLAEVAPRSVLRTDIERLAKTLQARLVERAGREAFRIAAAVGAGVE